MKVFFVIYLVISPFVLCKESVSDLMQLLEDPNILMEIVKRLGNDESDKKSVAESRHNLPNQNTGSLNNCKYNNFTQTIIQTKASTTAGAVFLDSVNGLESNSECVGKCCELDGCELAVYENKGDRLCYLFRCKDVKTGKNYCEFANHDDYISTSISHNIFVDKAPESNNDHENDLHDLSDGSKESAPSTTTPSTTTTTTPGEPEQPYSISLGGKCRSKYSCEDPEAACLSGTCLCKSLYYNKKGTCREVCGHSRFECQDVDLDGPDCVRLSLVCDGINDCHDGSDEVKCQTEAPIRKKPWFSKNYGFGSNFDSQLQHPDSGTASPQSQMEAEIVVTPSVDSAAMAKDFHNQQLTDTSNQHSNIQKLDFDMKSFGTKSDKPSEQKFLDQIQTDKYKQENIVKPVLNSKPKPVVVWPDSSSDNQEVFVPLDSRRKENAAKEDFIPQNTNSKHSYQYHKEIPERNYVPDSQFSFQGKKGPSYFVASKPTVHEENPPKTDVKIVSKPKPTTTLRPQPVHDAHMITNTHPESDEHHQPIQQGPAVRKHPNSQNFGKFYQPPYRPQYPSDLSLSDPDDRPRDITPYIGNRNYPKYRPQQFSQYNQLGYQNQVPVHNQHPKDGYRSNYLYDYPDYNSYQEESEENSRPDRPFLSGLFNMYNNSKGIIPNL